MDSRLRFFGWQSQPPHQQYSYFHHYSTGGGGGGKGTFRSRLFAALQNAKIEWYTIPVAAGIGFLGVTQFYKVSKRERAKRQLEEEYDDATAMEERGPDDPERRRRRKHRRPWQVQVLATLPLKALSRLWGKFNEIQIPYYLRVPGFKLYAWTFGVNLSEVSEPDLHVYPNLAAFFYRSLKPGCRPIDPNKHAMVSPADGRVIQFGTIEDGEVEQVKGVTYPLDKLLGLPGRTASTTSLSSLSSSTNSSTPFDSETSDFDSDAETLTDKRRPRRPRSSSDEESLRADEEFAKLNGISYTLPYLLGTGVGVSEATGRAPDHVTAPDQSVARREGGARADISDKTDASEAEVRRDLERGADKESAELAAEHEGKRPQAQARSNSWWNPFAAGPHPDKPATTLYYIVIYLAPGDYHRFHSPVPWVVTSRRHFPGNLYSVHPWLLKHLPGLFTLNERVVLLGRWRHGFFSYTPVGATNVGSIRVNFDAELRTNNWAAERLADRLREEASQKGEVWEGYVEAGYASASQVLGGVPLRRGEEMGGFALGSTVVLVFEGPVKRRSRSRHRHHHHNHQRKGEVYEEGEKKMGLEWVWKVHKGQKVKVGEAIGEVVECEDA